MDYLYRYLYALIAYNEDAKQGCFIKLSGNILAYEMHIY